MWLANVWHSILSVDTSISIYLNSFVHRSWSFDQILILLAWNELIKGVTVTAAFWYLWFSESNKPNPEAKRVSRATLLGTLLICAPMLVVIRIMVLDLPYRVRPLLVPGLHLVPAYGFDTTVLETWSSFPSDHAAMFFGLAAGLFLVSRRTGIFMYLYTTLIIGLPRVIMGIHYSSDILVGALIGVVVTQTIRVQRVRSLLTDFPLRLLEVSPGLFYCGLFILTFLTADLYAPARGIAKVILRVLKLST